MKILSFDKVKVVVVGIVSAITSWLGILAIPIFLLLGLNITDYITGLIAARYRQEQINSYKGFRGIAKKLCMLMLVGVGAVLDWVLMFAGNTIGLESHFVFLISTIVAIWLICNEIISILENMMDIGVELPAFLHNVTKYIKRQVELSASIEEVPKNDL